MPIKFYIKPNLNLIVCVHLGKVPDDEFLASYKSLYESDNFSSGMSQLVDLREADSSLRSKDALMQCSDFVELKLSSAKKYPRVAVVAPSDLSFGISRMYGAYSSSIPWEFVVFRTVDTALDWLGKSEGALDDLTG